MWAKLIKPNGQLFKPPQLSNDCGIQFFFGKLKSLSKNVALREICGNVMILFNPENMNCRHRLSKVGFSSKNYLRYEH